MLALLTGCAGSDSGPEWTGIPAGQPPEDDQLQTWNVVWDDAERQWETYGRDEKPLPPSAVSAEKWLYEGDAFVLRVRADEQLNFSRGSAHTAAVHLLQTRKVGELARQLEFPTEVYRLLRRGADDPHVLAMDRIIVGPGREEVVQVDRADTAQYIVLVVGYTDYSRTGSTRVIPIPGIVDKPHGRDRLAPGNVIQALNPFASSPKPRPARIEGWLRLGEQKIDSLRMIAR